MLTALQVFRDRLDSLMLQCMDKRVAIYGYDSYAGRFLKWYAAYYHGIEIDWLISEDMSVGRGYDREVFRPSMFDFGYKDIKKAVIWLAHPLTEELRVRLEGWGYKANTTYFDFYDAVYGINKANIHERGFSFLRGWNGNMGVTI